MLALISSFWNQILSVFIPDRVNFFIAYSTWNFGDGVTNSVSLSNDFGRTNLANVLAGFTLMILCFVLLYQVYRVIHAFIGGFYEDDF